MGTSQTTVSRPGQMVWGWAGVAVMGLVYTGLFILNLLLPLEPQAGFVGNPLAMRLSDWCQWALALAALVVVIPKWRGLRGKSVLLGLTSGSGHCV